ncbi:DUF2971 domain-containing protein [Lutibacter aestuarii]|uniref:DUF2971 domain-containing protein n=1 Tax=Lutibacter aestuarii TaxID=861111 RepID=A0ABW2Z9I2_9FLAO
MAYHIEKHPAFEALKLDLEKKIVKELQSFNFNKKSNRLNILYHYTDLSGLKGIIENQSFFSSNSAYLNDKKEFHYGVDLFKSAISNYNILNEYQKKIINEIRKELDNKLESYHFVTCFSLEGDLLSQWRAYADDGKGIAIGFDLKNLVEAFNPKASGMLIEYNDQTQKQAVDKIVQTTVSFYESKLSLLESINQEHLYDVIAQEANEIFNKYIGQFKHSSFKEEREYRFDLSIDNDINKARELSYRVSSNNLLVPFLHLKTNLQEELESRKKSYPEEPIDVSLKKIKHKVKLLPIKKLIIGPSLDFELNKKSIIGFLKKNGYSENIEINQSKVPYRI